MSQLMSSGFTENKGLAEVWLGCSVSQANETWSYCILAHLRFPQCPTLEEEQDAWASQGKEVENDGMKI